MSIRKSFTLAFLVIFIRSSECHLLDTTQIINAKSQLNQHLNHFTKPPDESNPTRQQRSAAPQYLAGQQDFTGPNEPKYQHFDGPTTLITNEDQRYPPFVGLADNVDRLSLNGRIWDSPHGYMRSVSTSKIIQPEESQSLARPETSSNSKGQKFVTKSDLDYKCQKRGVVRILRSAKNLLADGLTSLERNSMPGKLMLGSSLFAAAIPLVVFLMPDASGRRRSILDLAPDSLGPQTGRFNLQARVDSFMGWVERSVEHLPNFPRLHPQECVKRSICEAHNNPDRYGAIGFMLRLLFPATNLNLTDKMDSMEFKVINKYRHAAGFGSSRRVDTGNGSSVEGSGSQACREEYDDCFVSLLDVAQNLIDLFLGH